MCYYNDSTYAFINYKRKEIKHLSFYYKPVMTSSMIVDELWKLKSLAKKMNSIEEFAFDTETNTKDWVVADNDVFRIVGISISWGFNNNYYIPLGHRRDEDYYNQLEEEVVVKYLKPCFERTDVRVIGHNLKFDMHVMSRIGIHIQTADLFDTMIAEWLCDENTPNGLKGCSMRRLEIAQTHFAEVTNTVPNEVKKQFGLKASNKATMDLTLIEDCAPYALADSFYTWCLYVGYLDELHKEKMDKIYSKVYRKFIRVLYTMEEQGANVAVDRLEEMDVEITKDLEEMLAKMFDLVGMEFNPNSNKQLQELLFGYVKDGGTPTKLSDVSFGFRQISATKSGAPQCNSDTIWTLSNLEFKNKRKKQGVEFCKLLNDYKRLGKLASAFVRGLKKQLYSDGKAHPTFNIIGTDSGRISCSRPNLQQLPKAGDDDKYQIRSLFIGSDYVSDSEGNWVSDDVEEVYSHRNLEIKRKKIVALDFANLEMRILTHFSQDQNLLDMFNNGDDTHGSTAVNMFELDCNPDEVKKKYPHLRQAAKVINFLLMYGGSAPTLYNNLKGDHYNPIDLGDKKYLEMYHVKNGKDVAQIYIDKYFTSYAGVSTFIKNQRRYAHRHEYVYTLLKRKRRLPNINSYSPKDVSYCERLAVNACIQGSAADLTMSAQNRVFADHWYEEHGVHMILQVHDELVFDCPEKYVDECIERTKHYMEHAFGDNVSLNLPMRADADFGDSYQEAK